MQFLDSDFLRNSLLRLTKIYTKIGDRGTTHLANGAEVSKSSRRLEAYGTVDELNSFVGLLIEHLESPGFVPLKGKLIRIQHELFDVGGELSTPMEALKLDRQRVVGAAEVTALENDIDEMNETLEPLANFVLPGGNIANAQAHVCRTICRRAERAVVSLMEESAVRKDVQIYLNRLSDWFFVVARFISNLEKTPEVLWDQKNRVT